jgi:Holliday junction resolvase RusA-like endonuclease
MDNIHFFVPGTPAPGGSKTQGSNPESGKKWFRPACKRTKPWMNCVSAAAREAYQGELLTDPIRTMIQFRLLRKKGHYGTGKNSGVVKSSARKFPTVKPDLVKLTRSTEDALTGIIWRDDCQVCSHILSKIYVDRDPGAVITVAVMLDAEIIPTDNF